jgi:hypothetical protein
MMKIIRLVIKPSLISRYHPKTKCGVGVQLKHISFRRYLSYGSHMETLICAQVPLNKVDRIRWRKPQSQTLDSYLG